jgi:hypothetical protein
MPRRAACGYDRWMLSDTKFKPTQPAGPELRQMSAHTIAPVIKRFLVAVEPAVAFSIYVSHMSDWWPMASHSVGHDAAGKLRIDERAGGLIREVTQSGEEHLWGTITAFAPPLLFAHSWHPGNTAGLATMVNVTFEPDSGGSRLVLLHSGWEARGANASLIRKQYDHGWSFVLSCFTRYVNGRDMVTI